MLFLSTLRMWRYEVAARRARPESERKRTPMVRKRKPIVELLEERVPMGTFFNGFGLGSANILPVGLSLPGHKPGSAAHALVAAAAPSETNSLDLENNAAALATAIVSNAPNSDAAGTAAQITEAAGSFASDNDPGDPFANEPTRPSSGGSEVLPPNSALHSGAPVVFSALPIQTPHAPANVTNPTPSQSAGKPGSDPLFQAVSGAGVVKIPPATLPPPSPTSSPPPGGGGIDPPPTTWAGYPRPLTKEPKFKIEHSLTSSTTLGQQQNITVSRSDEIRMFGNLKTYSSSLTRVSPTAVTRQSSTSSPFVGPEQDVSQFIGGFLADEFEVSITINPTNTNNIVAFSNAQILGGTIGSLGGMMISYTFDGGNTWNPHYIATGDDNFPNASCCDPSIAFDHFGNLWFSYVDFSPDNDSTVVNLSTDGGISYRTVFDYLDTSNLAIDQPKLAVGSNSVWVVWADVATTSEPDYRLQTANAYIGGLGMWQGFFGIQDMPFSPDLTFQNFGKVSVGPNNQVMLTWVDPSNASGPQTIWGDVNLLGTRGQWGTPFLISRTNVGSFYPITPQPVRTISPEPEPAYDRSGGPFNGRVYVVYTNAPSFGSNSTDIFVRHSDNNGQTWSAPLRVTDDHTGNPKFFPRIQVDQTNGHIAVSWLDSRLDPTASGADEFIAFSADGGNTFSQNLRVSSATSSANATAIQSILNDWGDFTGLAFFNGLAYPAWPDNSTALASINLDAPNSFDIATARVVDPFAGGGGGGGGGGFGDTLIGGVDNDSSSNAANEGILSSSASLSAVSLGADGTDNFPDQDWFKWTMSHSGTFTATETTTAGGPLELHVFKLVNGTLVDVGGSSTAVAGNDTIYVEVKGQNSAPGVFTTGQYNLNVTLA